MGIDVGTEHSLRSIISDLAFKATNKMWDEIETSKSMGHEDLALRTTILDLAATFNNPNAVAQRLAAFAAAILKRPEVANFWKEESPDINPVPFAVVVYKESDGNLGVPRNFYMGSGDRWVIASGEHVKHVVPIKMYRRPHKEEVDSFINALPPQSFPALLSALTW